MKKKLYNLSHFTCTYQFKQAFFHFFFLSLMLLMQVSYLCWGFLRQASEGTEWALAPPVCSGRYSQPWWERIQGCTDSPYNSLNTAFTSGAHRRDVRPIQASPWPPECFSHRLLLVQSHKSCSFNNRFQVQEWDEQDAQTTHTHTHTHTHLSPTVLTHTRTNTHKMLTKCLNLFSSASVPTVWSIKEELLKQPTAAAKVRGGKVGECCRLKAQRPTWWIIKRMARARCCATRTKNCSEEVECPWRQKSGFPFPWRCFSWLRLCLSLPLVVCMCVCVVWCCGEKSVVRWSVSYCSVLLDRSLQHKTEDYCSLSLSLSLSLSHSGSISCTPLSHLPCSSWAKIN